MSELLNCYACGVKILTQISKAGRGQPTSDGKKAQPLDNYTCLDVWLKDRKGTEVAYATPVCRDCSLKLLEDKDAVIGRLLKSNLIRLCRKYDIGPKNFINSENLELIQLMDLNPELVQNGVI